MNELYAHIHGHTLPCHAEELTALNGLGYMYLQGEGVDKNYTKAYAYFMKVRRSY